MTLAQVATQIERSVRTAERVAAKLIKEGRLRYVGPKRGGHWEVAVSLLFRFCADFPSTFFKKCFNGLSMRFV